MRAFKDWYGLEIQPMCVWDGWLHIVLPVILMVSYGVINTKQRLMKEQKMGQELDEMRAIISQISFGIAITENSFGKKIE